MSSIRSDVGIALKTRLETIKTANGYPVGFAHVFYDEIPLSLELSPEDLPAVFLLDEGGAYAHEHQVLNVTRSWRLQLIHGEEATDEQMNELIRMISKAIFANHPTANVQDAFRFHERVYQVSLETDETDLRMIEGNRIATVNLLTYYRTRPQDL